MDDALVAVNPNDLQDQPILQQLKLLCRYTSPYPHEERVWSKFLAELRATPDGLGNYQRFIGHSSTIFAAHLDTADSSEPQAVNFAEDDPHILKTDGSSILGADDRSGILVLYHLMQAKVPGLYWFFVGEEHSGIGSGQAAKRYGSELYAQGYSRMICFDRKGQHSIITHQKGTRTASDEFAWALAAALGMNHQPDPSGSFTDSKSFSPYIPECTNISVGYQNAHFVHEQQDVGYLERLIKRVVQVDWEALPTYRQLGQ